MITIVQIQKLFSEVEFSPQAKGKIDEIFERATQAGELSDEDKKKLIEIIKADMVLDAMDIEANKAVLARIDDIFKTK